MSEKTVNFAQTNDYFTKDIDDAIRDMTEEEMIRELRNIEQSRAWIAILKYNQARLYHCQTSIFSADPFKDPTTLTRSQGIMLGLSDLQNLIISLKLEEDEKMKKETSKED